MNDGNPPVQRSRVDLGRRLIAVSADSARFALRNYSSPNEDDRLMSALRAGMSVEHLQLATLFSIDPLLIATSGHGAPAMRTRAKLALGISNETDALTSLATLTFADASNLLKLIAPQLQIDLPGMAALEQSRNAAAHLGVVDTVALAGAIGTMARSVETLLNFMNADRVDFWTADLIVAVTLAVHAEKDSISRRVSSRIARAEHRLSELLMGVGEVNQATLMALLEVGGSSQPVPADSAAETCPVCHRQGLVELDVLEAEELSEDHGDDGSFYWFERTGIPISFMCRVCGLELEGPEMTAAGVDLKDVYELESRAVTQYEAYGNWEPDEDWLRGR